MSRTLSLLLTIAFLEAQIFSFAHAAQYGSLEHEHEEATCEICLSAKHQDCANPAATSGTYIFRHTQYITQTPVDFIVVRDIYDAGITRGPPLFS